MQTVVSVFIHVHRRNIFTGADLHCDIGLFELYPGVAQYGLESFHLCQVKKTLEHPASYLPVEMVTYYAKKRMDRCH